MAHAERKIVENALKIGGTILGLVGIAFGCGYVRNPDHRGIGTFERFELHDHEGQLTVRKSFSKVPYDEAIYGPKQDWLEEGERIPNHPNSTDGKAPIHRHSGRASSGPHEFQYE